MLCNPFFSNLFSTILDRWFTILEGNLQLYTRHLILRIFCHEVAFNGLSEFNLPANRLVVKKTSKLYFLKK